MQEEVAVEQPPKKHGSVFTGVGYAKAHVVPHEADLRQATAVLNEGKKIT